MDEIEPTLLSPRGLLECIDRLHAEAAHEEASYELGSVPGELLTNLIENEDALAGLESREFEELVADLLLADGYEDVRLVPRNNAPGPDIIAFGQSLSGQKLRFLVECKAWKGAVGIDEVRTMAHRMDHEEPATGGIIVTTSRFTSTALQQAELYHRWRLDLKDAAEVRQWIKRHTQRVVTRIVEHVSLSDSAEGSVIVGLLSRGDAPSLKPAMNSTCQRCGGPVICGYVDVGGVDYYDNYFHLCGGCLDHQHLENFESGPSLGNAGFATCPFCKRVW
jgi:hypothetical protein